MFTHSASELQSLGQKAFSAKDENITTKSLYHSKEIGNDGATFLVEQTGIGTIIHSMIDSFTNILSRV